MGVPKAKPNAKKGGEGEEKKTEKRSGCEAAALGQWVRGAAKPPVQRELRSPGEAAGTGHRACRIPKSHQEPACPIGPLLLFPRLETVWSIAPLASFFPHLRLFQLLELCLLLCIPSVLWVFSASYQSKPGGDTLPFCLTVPAPGSSVAPSGSVLICFHTVEEELHPSGNGGVQWCGVPAPAWA